VRYTSRVNDQSKIDKSTACLLMGAIGDALGAPVEFLRQSEIIAKYGAEGISGFDTAYGKKGAITDDTQMTLFAADGLITAYRRGVDRGILDSYWTYTALSYIEWLSTQGGNNPNYTDNTWRTTPELFDLIKKQGQRAPGITCLNALQAMPNPPVPAHNDSKGCGTVMRVAPIGIFFGSQLKEVTDENLRKIYDEAVNDAAITHGHPTAHHSSGILAIIIAQTLLGIPLDIATNTALEKFGTEDLLALCHRAIDLVNQPPSLENLQSLGQGWVAEEALAMALYCSLLCFKNTLSAEKALVLSVNHSGDSDSTGAITGNLIGVSLGANSMPQDLITPDTEIYSVRPLLKKYGEELITILHYPGL
jgi:ADP-ribosylglycohydrolase